MSETTLILFALFAILGFLVGYFILFPWIDSRKR